MKLRLLVSLFCLVTLPAFAGNGAESFDSAAPLSKGSARIFLPKAHLLNAAEIRAGLLGSRQACRADVRAYGHELWLDHGNADRQVLRALQLRGFGVMNVVLDSWEAAQVARQNAALARLSALHGCSFDRPFLLAMRDAHVFAIAVFTRALAVSNDPTVRSLAATSLPKLRMHLNMAERLLYRR